MPVLQSCGERLVGGGGLVPFPHRALDFPGRFQNQPHKLLRRGGRLRHPQAAEPLGHRPSPGPPLPGHAPRSPLSKGPRPSESELVHNRAQQRIGALLEVGEHLLYGLSPKVARLRLVDHLERRDRCPPRRRSRAGCGRPWSRWCTPRRRPPSTTPPTRPSSRKSPRMRSRSSAAAFTVKVMASTSSTDRRPPDVSFAGEQPVGDAARQGERLPRAGAGGHHEGSIESGDGQALALFAAIEIHASLPGQS